MTATAFPAPPVILYVGSLEPGCNSRMRFKTLQKLADCKAIDTHLLIDNGLFSKIHYHFNTGPGITRLNRAVLNLLRQETPDILLVDNKPYLTASTLRRIQKNFPSVYLVNLLTDDPEGQFRRTWIIFRNTIKYYDVCFVQREINIGELKNRGAKRVELCLRSFDPYFHRPLAMNDEERLKYHTRVGFIGNWESIREEYIVFLIENGISVRVSGNNWQKGKFWPVIQKHFFSPGVYGDEYIRIINGMEIALHFLRHANRDEQDSRTFEIPACGVFMLAEKSEVHLSLFEAEKEAVYFQSKEELLEKVRYYLDHPVDRKAIAKAGYERCISSGYTHEARLKEVIKKILPQ